jgi:hypothetical protein
VIRSHHRLNRVFLNATHFLKERARAIAALRRTTHTKPVVNSGKNIWQEHLARSQKQSTQRAMQPQQQHTKPKGQRRAAATPCGDVRVTAFWKNFGKNIWHDQTAGRSKHSPAVRNCACNCVFRQERKQMQRPATATLACSC